MKFTNLELEKCAAREAAMRKNVFAKRGIGPKEEREIAMMEAIATHFQTLPGPTGGYPHGKLNSDDEGGINVALSSRMAPDGTRMVQFNFGKPVAWLSLPREQAVAFASLILKHAGVAIEIGVIGDAEDSGRRGQGDQKVEP